MAYKFWKKRWERVESFYELQEWGASESERGWVTVLANQQLLKEEQCVDYFKPGKLIRLIAKSAENGQIMGTVWKHYEPIPGVFPKAAEAPKMTRREPPKRPHDYMKEYAGELKETLQPLQDIFGVLDELRGGIFGKEEQAQAQPLYDPNQVPPLQYSGAAPWFLHPYIVHSIGEEVRGVIDHVAETVFGERPAYKPPGPTVPSSVSTTPAPPTVAEEGGDITAGFPKIDDYVTEPEQEEVPVDEEPRVEESPKEATEKSQVELKKEKKEK